MNIAEAFAGKTLYHSVYAPQGVTVESLKNYGAKLVESGEGYSFPDDSRGFWRENGTFPDGDPKWTFVAANQVVDEEGDDLA